MQEGATLGYRAVLLGAFSLWMMAPGAALWEPEGCASSGGCTWVQGAMPGQVVALTKGFGVWFPR